MSKRIFTYVAVFALVFGATGSVLAKQDTDANDSNNKEKIVEAYGKLKKVTHESVCTDEQPGKVHCNAKVVTENDSAKRMATASGYGPVQFRNAYGPTTGGKGRIIAIVDAYDHPNILSDLNKYSKRYGIPTMQACRGPIATARNKPCFQKVDQRGGTNFPSVDSGWALEIALDVEVAHAMCQDCSILLVEADTNDWDNMFAAEDRAGILGARSISNSWGSAEWAGQTADSWDGHFNKPNIAITAATGDAGYGVLFPAASRYVTAVGGTTLLLNSSGSYLGETAWSGGGSGCSIYSPRPTWQVHDSQCLGRMVADVSAVADPSTGAAVYTSVPYSGGQGWFTVGGTSLSTPIIAALYALSGNTAGAANSIPYANKTKFHDIVTGSNGFCEGSYLCTAGVGYDGPTGLGTPINYSAF